MIQIIAHLYAGSAGITGLRAFESKAIPILKKHRGNLISASYRSSSSSHEKNGNDHPNSPDEIHIIQFPSLSDFENYTSDAALASLREEHPHSIRKAELHITDSFHHY